MRAFLKFLINIGLLALLVWLVVRFTTLDDKIVEFLTKGSTGTGTDITQNACMTPWGVSIPNGSSVFAYQLSSPDTNGSCHEEERKCIDGNLQGSYEFGSCNSSDGGVITDTGTTASGNWSMPPTGVSCTTPWGQIISHGNYIVSYESPSSCRFQRRMCVDGELLGKFQYNYCMIAYQGGYNGFQEVSLTDGSNNGNSYGQIQDFSNSVNNGGDMTSPYANSNSSNGASRHYAPVNYGGNVANSVLPNDYWNQNAKGNVAIVGTSKTIVNPKATNGVSQYTLPKDWNANNYTRYDLTQKGCSSPWGTFVEHGQYVIAYRASTAAKGHSCEYERRNCFNGKLNGGFSFPSCNFQGQKTYTYATYQPQNQGYDKYYWVDTPVQQSNRSCRTPRGTTVKNGDYIRAYKYSSAPWSDGCEGEIRNCHDGMLDGSYSNQTCRLKQPTNNGCYGRNCGTWNNACSLPRGGNISHGQSVVAYSNSNGLCRSETRTCSNGWLQGSYGYQYCQNDNPTDNNACSLPRGGNIANGQSVLAYQNWNGVCNSERRYCINGSLNGSYSLSSCNNQGNSCSLPRGGNIANGQSVLAYQNWNGVCNSERRYCTNGSLNGSYSLSSCNNQGNSCSLPRGGNIANGQSVLAYQNWNGVCNSERRYCTNGSLNGSYSLASCNNQGNSCSLPRGGSIANGQSVIAYSNGSNGVCNSEARYCSNGSLNGSYTLQSCNNQGNSCSLPRGGSIANGQSVLAYSNSTNGICNSERRYCSNGNLNGSYVQQSCNYQNNSCSLPRGGTIPNGQSVIAYSNAYGVCNSESRYCSNGNLNGSYTQQFCSIQNNSCALPRGGSIAHGQSIEAFLNPTSPCTKEIRLCTNGTLNGSFGYRSCTLSQNSCSLPRGGSIAHGQSVTAYLSSTSPCYQETRYCNNGTLNGSYGYNSCSTFGLGFDTYGERGNAGWYDSVPDGEDTCHNDATAAFTCTAQDERTCIDYRKIENDCCVAGRAKYQKRTVTCVR